MSISSASTAAAIIFAFGVLVLRYRTAVDATRLRGPPRKSFLLGYAKELFRRAESDALCDQWEKTYGPAFEIPWVLGTRQVVLADLKAISHIFASQATTFWHVTEDRISMENLFGRNILAAEGEDHRRQRKALLPAFSNFEIRKLAPTLYDCAYTLKTSWDAMLQDLDCVTTDVQEWINQFTLDSTGISVLGHDFGSLKGIKSAIDAPLDILLNLQPPFLIALLNSRYPSIPIPSKTGIALGKLTVCIADVAHVSIQRAKKERELDSSREREDKSILGTLITSEIKNLMSPEEVMGQINVMLTAGYELTAIALTWALIELCRKPAVQDKLRSEVAEYSTDPTYEELTNMLPYMDAVTCETLRLHPPGGQTFREAREDNMVPLSEPVLDANGNSIDRIYIPKGTIVRIPTGTVGTTMRIWGDNGDEFSPERWLDNDAPSSKANTIQGYRHLLAFSDGPRVCLGKGLALLQFKIMLFVLIRHYSFELPGGLDTDFDSHMALLERPKTVGEKGCRVPLIVRKVGA